MRVCQLIESTAGGSLRVALDLTQGLVQAGDDVTFIYSPIRADQAFFDDIKKMPTVQFVPLPMRRAVGFHDLWAAWRLYRLFKRMAPFDVLHAHSSKAGGIARLVGLFLPRMKIVYTPHAFITMAPEASRLYGVVEKLLSYFCSVIVTVSEVEREHAVRDLHINPAKLRVVPNGIAFEEIVTRADAQAAMEAGETAPLLGFVGRLVPQKNPLRLIEAFSMARREKPDLRLVIVGYGPLLPLVHDLIAARGLTECVSLYTNHKARRFIPGFDLLVCSSDYEGIPLTFLEALRSGVPIVTTPVGGTQETVREGKTGFIAEDFSANALSRALLRYWDLSDAAQAKMRDAALAHGENFTTEKMTRAVRQIYQAVLCLPRSAEV